MLLICLAPHGLAQGIKFGGKAGAALTGYFETGTIPVRGGVVAVTSDMNRFTAGPSVEWRFTSGFGLELDALYKRFRYSRAENTSVSGVSRSAILDVSGNSWDIPVLLKHRWESRISPFVAAGLVMRYLDSASVRGSETVQSVQGTITNSITSEGSFPVFVPGITGAFGLEFGRNRIRVLPEIRVSGWKRARISDPAEIRQYQVELLFGVLF